MFVKPDTSSSSVLQYSTKHIKFQESLLVLVYSKLATRVAKSSLEAIETGPCHSVFSLLDELYTFFDEFAFVSQFFFESAVSAVKQFFKTTTFPVNYDELHTLSSISSHFGAKLESVFLEVFGQFDYQTMATSYDTITELSLSSECVLNYDFLKASSPHYFPRLKRLVLSVEERIDFSEDSNDPLKNVVNEGPVALSEGLKGNSTVTEITLMRNSLGNDGICSFANTLKFNSTITSVSVEHNLSARSVFVSSLQL
ncbi:hypothetical protein GEMRC1_012635 [Eukaryota sp. GEM-RC1]